MNAVVILFILGIALLAAEVCLPGAVAGILGGLAMLAGCVVAFQQFGFSGGMTAAVLAVVVLGLTLYLELVWLPKSRFGRAMVVKSSVDGTSQAPLADAGQVVGKEAEAVTPLAPSGFVLIEGRRYEAFCRSGHAGIGAKLRVIGLDNFRLIVTKP
jgi:membrane-bound ClpP family serine protease